ncbi:MAG: glycine cleavage system protein H [Actinobacteria bacterium]|nr:glycine cleavage system protein H [Actinomycetota bacterium]MCL6086957.1 glycine cleavage system protein H [Actinomycetota bacterium]
MSFMEYAYDKFIFKVKNEIYYHMDGCWVEKADNVATIGVTDFFQTLNGDVASVSLFAVGIRLKQGDPFGDIETMKVSFELTSPVSGEILEHNKLLDNSPELVNLEPYGNGWLLKVKLDDFEKDKVNLMDSKNYFDFMKTKVAEEGEKLKSGS